MTQSTRRMLTVGLMCLHLTRPVLAQESIDKWITDLQTGDDKARREAAYQLQQLGKEALPALPALIKALDDRQQQVWFHSVMAIAAIGPAAESAIPKLMEGFQRGRRGEGQEWYRSAYALGSIGPAALPTLREALGSDNENRKAGAAKALGFMGPAAAPAIPDLIHLLDQNDESIRNTAVETLVLIGPGAVEALRPVLHSEDREARACAAQALGELGAAAQPSVPELANLAQQDPAGLVRSSALKALRRLGYPELLPLLLTAFQRADASDQEAAIDALLLIRPPETSVVPALISLLQSDKAPLRQRTAYVLGRIGPAAAAAVPALIEAVDKTPEGKDSFVEALAKIGPKAAPELLKRLGSVEWASITEHWGYLSLKEMKMRALAPLNDALSDSNPRTRYAALRLLEYLETEARTTRAAILRLIDDAEPEVRARAIHTALAIKVSLDPVRSQLLRYLRDPSPQVRAAAAASMDRLGKQAAAGVPALLDLCDDSDGEVAVVAVTALGDVPIAEPGTAVQRLIPKLASENMELRKATMKTLGRLGKEAQSAVEKLAPMAKEGAKETRLLAIAALGKIGTPEVRATLEPLMKDTEPDIRAAVAAALGALNDREVLPVLITALKDDESSVRQNAAESIGRLGPAAREATDPLFEMLKSKRDWEAALGAARAIQVTTVPRLVEILQSDEPAILAYACERLGALGPDAKEALPALQPLRENKTDFIRNAARRAIRRIGGDGNR